VEDRIVREPERARLTGLSRTTWWALERMGQVPRRRQLGPGSIGWLLSELEEWIRSRQWSRAATPCGNPRRGRRP
jgi:predicted DNA-binding transcriptional regulator AlpA